MRKIYLACFVVSLFIVCETVFFLFVALSYKEAESRFRVTEAGFNNAVTVAVSNYLNIVPGISPEQISESRQPEIKVVLVSDLSIWLSPLRGYMCRVSGNDYRRGDYCEQGLILGISDGRVYVRAENGSIVILRRGPPPDPVRMTSRATSAAGRAEDLEEGAL